MTSLALRRLRRVCRGLLESHPVVGSIALRMTVTEAEIPNLSCDGTTLGYSRTWVEEAPIDDLREAYARVMVACVLKHHLRRDERDAETWNRASDEVTRPILRSAGLTDQPGGTETESVTEAYARLFVEPEDKPGDEPDDGKDGAGKDGAGSGVLGMVLDSPDGDQDGAGDEEQPGDSGSGTPSDGPTAPSNGSDGPSPANQSGREAEERKWDEIAMQAQMTEAMVTGIGTQMGSLQQLVEAGHQGTMDWRDELREFFRAAAPDDHTWARPNRRHIDSGLYLPSLSGEALGGLAICWDTSGSMAGITAAVWAEVRSAIEDVAPARVRIIQVDTAVHSDEEFDRFALPDEMAVRGGGGTAFSGAISRVGDGEFDTDCVLFFTDGFVRDWGEDPGVPVLWVTPNTDAAPPFGEVVHCPLSA